MDGKYTTEGEVGKTGDLKENGNLVGCGTVSSKEDGDKEVTVTVTGHLTKKLLFKKPL